jgi:hypothetical protein
LDDLINPDDHYVRSIKDLEDTGLIPPKKNKMIKFNNSDESPKSGDQVGISDNFSPKNCLERDSKTWSDPQAIDFIERVRKENRFQDKNSLFRETDAELLQAWTESSGPFNGPARDGNATPEEEARINRLAKIIGSYEVPDDVKMYRVESSEMLEAYGKHGILFRRGEVVKLEGFTSASATKEAVEAVREQFENYGDNMNVEIELFVQKGARAIPLSKASKKLPQTNVLEYEFQQEWLFQKDTEVLVLDNRTRNGKVFLKLLVLNR